MENKLKKIKIGNIEIEKTAALAPMASIADKAYRMVAKEFGAAYVVSEMVSAKGMFYNDTKTAELCSLDMTEHPAGIQIFGDEPKFMANAAARITEEFSPDIIDINMGCPVPKVAGNGAGSALMKDIRKAYEIAKEVVLASNVPVTAKIRAGWDQTSINAPELAKALEQAGVSAICVHGRTRNQMYGGHSDLDVIKRVKESVSCPVIGNGDIKTVSDCVNMYENTGCDLVMIGRGSYGRPWIFKQIRDYFETGVFTPEPTAKEKIDVMLHHAKLMCGNKGEERAMKEARTIVSFYIKGFHGAAGFRNACGHLSTFEELEALSQEILLCSQD